MKTVGTKVRILMLVLAFVLVANIAPAHAIDKSLTDAKIATLQDVTAIKVNGIIMPYRPYLVDGELYAPVQMMEIAFNAGISYDAIERLLTVDPKVALFEDKSNLVDKEEGKYIDKNLPEYTVAKFLCGTKFYVEKKWYNLPKVAEKIAMIDGKLWMSLDAMAYFTGSLYNPNVVEENQKFSNFGSITKNPYLTFPATPNGPTDVLATGAGQPYAKYLNVKLYAEDLAAGTWKGPDVINIDNKYHRTTVEVVFVKNANSKYTVTKTHTVKGMGDVTIVYENVPFENCGNYFDFYKKTASYITAKTIESDLIKGMDGHSYYYEGAMYHDYGYQNFFGTVEKQRFQWTR